MPRPSQCLACGCFDNCLYPNHILCEEAKENPRKPMNLAFRKEDRAINHREHPFKMFVELYGYLTEDQLKRLKEFIQNG